MSPTSATFVACPALRIPHDRSLSLVELRIAVGSEIGVRDSWNGPGERKKFRREEDGDPSRVLSLVTLKKRFFIV